MIRKQNINLKEYKIIKRKKSLWNSIFNKKRQKKIYNESYFQKFFIKI